jgi:hypothetical protein
MSKRISPSSKARTVNRVGSLVPQEIGFYLVIERMRKHTRVTDSGCWESTKHGNGTGYVQISFRGKRVFQHRLSYEIHKGPIPEGMHILHECDNRKCWNPAHLWVGTISDNKQDEIAKGRNYEANRTHCPRGHAYAEHGVLHGQNNWRHCRLCVRAKERRKLGWPEERLFDPPVPRGVRTGLARDIP